MTYDYANGAGPQPNAPLPWLEQNLALLEEGGRAWQGRGPLACFRGCAQDGSGGAHGAWSSGPHTHIHTDTDAHSLSCAPTPACQQRCPRQPLPLAGAPQVKHAAMMGLNFYGYDYAAHKGVSGGRAGREGGGGGRCARLRPSHSAAHTAQLLPQAFGYLPTQPSGS